MRRTQLMLLLIMALVPSIATGQVPQGNGSVHRWNGTQWEQIDGFGMRVAVGPDGSPWVVNSRNEIFRRVNGAFQKLPGGAIDIAVGGDGTAWVIGTDNRVYQWAGSDWRPTTNGGGVAISADQSGAPWVVGRSADIYRWLQGQFVRQDGGARDIGAGSDVWVIGTDRGIYQLGPDGWVPKGGSGVRISAGASGTAWVVNEAGEIYLWSEESFRRLSGTAIDIGVNANGDAWMVGTTERARPRGRRFE